MVENDYSGCLRKVPLTEDNFENKLKINQAKVVQNGQIRLSIKVKLFSNLDQNMAASILYESKVIKILDNETGLCKDLRYNMRCSNDEGIYVMIYVMKVTLHLYNN